MMEGISGEAASLAGHLKLANLCWIYDNNDITIEGNTALAYSDDVATRFIGYGWNVTRLGDANHLEPLDAHTYVQESDHRARLFVYSRIAYGAPSRHQRDPHSRGERRSRSSLSTEFDAKQGWIREDQVRKARWPIELIRRLNGCYVRQCKSAAESSCISSRRHSFSLKTIAGCFTSTALKIN